MLLYRSILEYGEAEYVVQKSRFIAHALPVESYEEARSFVAEIKEEYRDATHNVPAVICGPKQEIQWASDDGEPGGTSGLPVLKMIAGEGLTNLVMVITRYFGGIKLGTGGLARAYTTAAGLGLDAAGRCEVRDSSLLVYEFDYSYISKLQNLAADGKFEIVDPEYTDIVRTGIRCMSEYTEEIKGMMANLTNGKALLKREEKGQIRLKI
ncbi:MAG: YigZ family protein [Mogibacterium sp.]|nr:YigZ family protein [Mogibacterium sp.]MBQ6389266.1 YigZ family protein [Mogibacterium sp.]